MKKIIIFCIAISIPLVCSAENPFFGESMDFISIFCAVLLFLLLMSVVWIYYESKKGNNKKSSFIIEDNLNGQEYNHGKDKRSNVNKILELKEEIKELNKLISEKNEEINELKKENSFLRGKNKIIKDSPSENSNDEKKKDIDNISEKNDYINPNSSDAHSDFIALTVVNGNLSKAESDHTIYYRSWRNKDKLLFEFVNNERTRKAINNRTIIIEPFCIKQENSKSPDISEEIETIIPGVLNEDFTLLKKAEIIYK